MEVVGGIMMVHWQYQHHRRKSNIDQLNMQLVPIELEFNSMSICVTILVIKTNFRLILMEYTTLF